MSALDIFMSGHSLTNRGRPTREPKQDKDYNISYSMTTVAEDMQDLNKIIKVIDYLDSLKTKYYWRELYDTWNFPVTYKFDFVYKEDLMVCKLFVGGNRVNLTLTNEKT